MTTFTSLTLRALFKAAVERTGIGSLARSMTGLTPPAEALLVAAAAQALPQGVVLYVLPSHADLDRAVEDVRFFLAALEGLSEGGVEHAVLPLSAYEADPYRGLSPHLGVTSGRARALHGMMTGAARIVVAPAAALLPRISAPDRLLALSIALEEGLEIAPDDLAALLTDAGFSREDPADEHGEFAVRGGILDVFPAGEAQPVRLEFVGDTIESLRRYDPATQRSVAAVDRVTIVPLRDVLAGDRSATVFAYLARARASQVIVSEPDEVDAVGGRLLEHLRRSYESASLRPNQAGDAERPLPLPELFAEWPDIQSRLSQGISLARLGPDSASSTEDLAPETPHPAPGTVHGTQHPALGTAPSTQHVSNGSRGPTPASSHSATSRLARAAGAAPGTLFVRCQPTVQLKGRVGDWVQEIRTLRDQGHTVVFVAATPGRAERTVELLQEYGVPGIPIERAEDARYAAVLVAVGRLSRGFRLPDALLQIYAEPDLFEEARRGGVERRAPAAKAFPSDFRDLKVSDFVVHVDHGIGMFVGLRQIAVGARTDSLQEFLELQYAGQDKLFVPVERLDLVQKYAGATKPQLDRLGGTSWERAKARVRKAMRDMAEELLKLYAARKAVPGHAFSPDSHWQQEFEAAFEYELTPDQEAAIADVKRDMESPAPMDRLLCGDVGYGKTEVAMRAAFKAVMDGKQVAFLAPTTVLAFQHDKTLKERFAGFPVRIEMVSRFRSRAEQKAVLADLRSGKVDIIVGTHRLLSADVEYSDLGLLVVDEEQRFGVAHKERIKRLRKKVDVLTMSATPIPRTLNMSLVGIRDMSIIETPPKDRLSIQTHVVRFEPQVVGRAIRSELDRGGQIFFVHNRVESIFSIGSLIAKLVPEARVVIGHGQMSEDVLERAMLDFVARKFDVLLATTIVENGLDIPNANTIIINRADQYGLSQLYQLRGRVGRSDRPAYAFLLIPPEDNLSPVAKKRLAAIREFSDLGSGFRVAALDLEIRGAGNLLGGDQSGEIEAVGFELYMKLLEQAVRELRGEELEDEARATVNLHIDLRIAESYIPDMNQRLMLYRKVAGARREEDIARVLDEAVDRYGPVPESLLNLAEYGRIRVMADALGLESIDREARTVVLRFRPQAKVDPVQIVALVRQRRDLTLVPPAGLKLNLDAHDGSRQPGVQSRPAGRQPGADEARPPRWSGSAAAVSRPEPGARRSWWTLRAREREIMPGFTRAEMLKEAKEDPRSPGGLFERVAELLSDLTRGSMDASPV